MTWSRVLICLGPIDDFILYSTTPTSTELNQKINSQRLPHTSPNTNYGVFLWSFEWKLTALLRYKTVSFFVRFMAQFSHMKQSWIWNTTQRQQSTNHVYCHRAAPWRYEHIRLEQLTHWGQYEVAAVCQMAYSHVICWIKMYKFRLSFHWSLFPRVQSTIIQHLVQMFTCRLNGAKPLWLATNG